jgi:hypothetical protein
MKKRTRHEIADAAVRRWCRFYDLTPYFWRANPENTKSTILARAESQKRRRRVQSDVKYGEPEDRADCMAMIVGTLRVKGFERSELCELLEIANGTVAIYTQHYKSMPDETRRALISLDGEKASEFYHSIIVDARIEREERLMKTRERSRSNK